MHLRQNRRHHVDMADGIGDFLGFIPCLEFDDQRDAQGALIDEIGMSVFAVLAQAFAMIAGDDDHGRIVEHEAFELFDYLADAVIDIGDLANIRIPSIF